MTPTADEIAAEIKAGLEGVTPGPWTVNSGLPDYESSVTGTIETIEGYELRPVVCDVCIRDDWTGDGNTNAAHIARCSPDRIATLIAAYEAQRAEIAARDALIAEPGEALRFYRDGFRYIPKRTRTGIDLSTWKPKEALLDDCGETARALLTGRNARLGEGEPLRCEVTGNPVGTDTWGNGGECQCGPCQKYVSAMAFNPFKVVAPTPASRQDGERVGDGPLTDDEIAEYEAGLSDIAGKTTHKHVQVMRRALRELRQRRADAEPVAHKWRELDEGSWSVWSWGDGAGPSPTPSVQTVNFYASPPAAEVSEAMVEAAARAIVRSKGAHSTASDERWPGTVAFYRELCDGHPEYAAGGSLITDAFRDARAALTAALAAKGR